MSENEETTPTEETVEEEASPPKPFAYVEPHDLQKIRKSGQSARVTLYGPDTSGYQDAEAGRGDLEPIYTLPFV